MTKLGTHKKTATHKLLIIGGLVLWLGSALLFALNDGPFKATPLQVTAIIGFVMLVAGLIAGWRVRRQRP